ncbi:MAG: tRNA (cytidine(34)-2'-O)-methyltransferase [Syntrophobacteraceae bacterium]|nr:tRNA (cytidine(34)-2'-O)-methyltransferase [Syntrophobacteraceae bacterium]
MIVKERPCGRRASSVLGEALGVLLYEPEIPQNTGNIARTCAATHTPLYLVGQLGFKISDKYLKRAGLDYWPYVRMKHYPDFEAARCDLRHSRLVYFSAHAVTLHYDFSFRPGDCLIFGPESRGLPDELVVSYPGDRVKIPIDRLRVRSLNLSTAVGIALFEALRQLSD